jgi:hypothetical protein
MWNNGPTELMRKRYPPNGDVAEWVRYGPPDPPETPKATTGVVA